MVDRGVVAEALDERVITGERTLSDATGATWAVQVPTFVDKRLASLLESRRAVSG